MKVFWSIIFTLTLLASALFGQGALPAGGASVVPAITTDGDEDVFTDTFNPAIINPIEGTWANKQVLILDIPTGATAYYTTSDSDPEMAGLIYDGPLVLDATGLITLHIVVAGKDGERFQKNVVFTVAEQFNTGTTATTPDTQLKIEKSDTFINSMVKSPIIEYTAGGNIDIPEGLEYALGDEISTFETGQSLYLSPQTIVSRYVPLTIKKPDDEDITMGVFGAAKESVTPTNDYRWRFVIHVSPVASGVYSKRDAPFNFNSWDTIDFTDKRYIYKIDDKMWEQPTEPVTIDRKKQHTIKWQSLEYSKDNPIKTLTLPPRPSILTKTNEVGTLQVARKGDSLYKFGYRYDNGKVSALYNTFVIDTFIGDYYRGIFKIGVYYDGIYQGDEEIPYCVNKRLPPKPVITSNATGSTEMRHVDFSRKLVTLFITTKENTDVYFDVAGPVIANSENYFSNVLFNFHESTFALLGGKVSDTSYRMVLHPSNKGAVAYKVRMYAEDRNKNRSSMAEYSLIIDTCNFYIDTTVAPREDADGTKANPYTTFEQIMPYINDNRMVNVYLRGNLQMPNRNINIQNNVVIMGHDNAIVTFPPNSALFIHNASLDIEDCVINYNAKSGKVTGGDSYRSSRDVMRSLFQLEHGVLDLNNVVMSVTFEKNGTLINSDTSAVTLHNCVFTVNSDDYLSIISSVGSKILVTSTQLTSVSQTAVPFSCQGGTFEITESKCFITATLGRIAELFNTQSTIMNNIFTAQLTGKRSTGEYPAVYVDDKNIMIKYEQNDELGF